MVRKISLQMLQLKDACEEGQEAFQQVFGEETVFSPTEEIVEKLLSNDYLDFGWAASKVTSCTAREWNDISAPLREKAWELEDAIEDEYDGDDDYEPYGKRVNAAWQQFRHDRAMEFLKLYEEYGVGEKVEESTVEDPAKTELQDQVNN